MFLIKKNLTLKLGVTVGDYLPFTWLRHRLE